MSLLRSSCCSALEHLSVRQIHLVVYPSHFAGDESKLVPIVRKLCEVMPDRFLDGTRVLQRTVDSPQRSKGGDQDINVQFNTIRCELPRGEENAVYCCVDDVLNTGSSFHVFAELMTRAGANSKNLHGLALGRFTALGPGHDTQSDFVIPAASLASDVSVSFVLMFHLILLRKAAVKLLVQVGSKRWLFQLLRRLWRVRALGWLIV